MRNSELISTPGRVQAIPKKTEYNVGWLHCRKLGMSIVPQKIPVTAAVQYPICLQSLLGEGIINWVEKNSNEKIEILSS